MGLIVLFMAAQGAAVFATAWLALRLLKINRWPAKLAAMTASYSGWIVVTVVGYALLGGEFGMMDGGLALLTLCQSALIASGAYALPWILWPRRGHGPKTLTPRP